MERRSYGKEKTHGDISAQESKSLQHVSGITGGSDDYDSGGGEERGSQAED